MIKFNDNQLDFYQTNRLKLSKIKGVLLRTNEEVERDKPKELREVLYAFTHEPIPNETSEQREKLIKEFEVNMFIEFEGLYNEETEHNICVCSCNSCIRLYHIIHLKTLKKFAVGSTCIGKFIDEDFEKK